MILRQNYEADISAIAQIAAVPTILEVVCRTTGMGFAAVARVTEDRWIACGVRDDIAFGLKPGGELKVETTICNEIRQSHEAVVIDHVAQDPEFRTHHTAVMYGFQSYISMPIILPDGSFFGTLCAIDPKPARLRSPEIIGMFKLFAELIAFHLDAHYRLAASAADLTSAQENAELREQFIAVLGHDLKNPLASISSGARLLLRREMDDESVKLLNLMQNSVLRMAALVDSVLDFARGRLGGGLELERKGQEPVLPVLQQIVAELQAAHPTRSIETEFGEIGVILCDRIRVGQLLSNLLANALTHGAAERPVVVRAQVSGGELELSVANAGAVIPPETVKELFKPFVRGAQRPGNMGLGLGLYIASEIARAHNGTLTATSSPSETRFTFRMPVG